MHIADELNWLKLERKNYQVQKQRQAKRAFLERMRKVVFPCYEGEGQIKEMDVPIIIESEVNPPNLR